MKKTTLARHYVVNQPLQSAIPTGIMILCWLSLNKDIAVRFSIDEARELTATFVKDIIYDKFFRNIEKTISNSVSLK